MDKALYAPKPKDPMPFTKDKHTLLTLENWEQLAGPKSKHHWVDGRSAKEMARAWLTGGDDGLPPEVSSVLIAHPRFGAVSEWTAEPEAKLRFDDFAGEPRNSDLAVHARDAFGRYLIAVEAKADESYGETLSQTLQAADQRRRVNPRSNGVARVEQLAQSLLGVRVADYPPAQALRYQLLTACAGAICEAERRGYSRAVMLVHEFITFKTSDDNHIRNAADLSKFLQALSPPVATNGTASGLYGPFHIPGGGLFKGTVDLFIGKVSRNLRVGAL